jgi:hypothetical protein
VNRLKEYEKSIKDNEETVYEEILRRDEIIEQLKN